MGQQKSKSSQKAPPTPRKIPPSKGVKDVSITSKHLDQKNSSTLMQQEVSNVKSPLPLSLNHPETQPLVPTQVDHSDSFTLNTSRSPNLSRLADYSKCLERSAEMVSLRSRIFECESFGSARVGRNESVVQCSVLYR